MWNKKIHSLSFNVWLFIVAVLCISFSSNQKNSGKQFIVSDGYAYYFYLPAAFIYHDLKFNFVNDLPQNLYKKYWLTTYPGKKYRIPKMTIGVALLMSPFFLIGHGYALAFHYPLTGFSNPYQDSVAVAALFYCIMGLFFVRKSLLKFFSEGVTSFCLLLLIAATTLYNYSLSDTSMSHVYSFFAISLMIWFSIRWHETFLKKNFLCLFLTLGFIALIRPVNLMTGLFPLLFAIEDAKIREQKEPFIQKQWKTILVGVFIFFVPIATQLFLWKYQTETWLFDSYVGEHFF